MIVNADASPLGIVRPHIKAALRRLTRRWPARRKAALSSVRSLASVRQSRFQNRQGSASAAESGLWRSARVALKIEFGRKSNSRRTIR
jgi:hypothetical protein